jgi:hypothetical protein
VDNLSKELARLENESFLSAKFGERDSSIYAESARIRREMWEKEDKELTAMTHTCAKLMLTRAAFNEIRDKLIAAGYEPTRDDYIDMSGIAVVPCQERECCRRCNTPLPIVGICPVCMS